MEDEIRFLEALSFRAWPAVHEHDIDGWRVRESDGLTRRGNSVWAFDCAEVIPFDERLARVETFYAQRGLPSAFQLCTYSSPPDLDARLEARGYVVDSPVSMQTAPCERIVGRSPRISLQTRVAAAPFEDWVEICARRSRFARSVEGFLGFVARIGTRARMAVSYVDGRPVAAGLGVVEANWLGIYAMLTIEDARRRGAAAQVLSTLAERALQEGANHAYLLVEQDNTRAKALYAKHGFEERARYHYRVRGAGVGTGC